MVIRKINRRHFLRDLSGAMLALPVLSSLEPARAQVAPKRLRFITVRTSEGAYRDHWFPNPFGTPTVLAPYGKAYDLSKYPAEMSPIFGALFNKYKSRTLIVKGLYPFSAYHGHNSAFMLAAFSQEMYAKIPPQTPTIDQIINEKTAPAGTKTFNCFLSSLHPFYPSGHIWERSGSSIVRAVGIWDPRTNFDRFFSGFAGGETQRLAALDRRKLVVDRVRQAYKSFVAKRSLAAADKSVFDNYIEGIFELETKINREAASFCAPPSITVAATYKSDQMYSNALSYKANAETVTKLNIDIAAAALQCDLIRVANFSMFAHPLPQEPHDLHHRVETPEVRAKMLELDQYYAKHLAYLLDKLDAIVDSDGKSLLDNSLLAYGKEMSHGNSHENENTQVALFGGAGGNLKMGQYIDFNTGDCELLPMRRPDSMTLGLAYNQLPMTIMMAFGLTPADWEIGGVQGFGQYVKRYMGTGEAIRTINLRSRLPGT
ncbi:MAG: DUF1552 domain-containing protein [Bdellovibrionales bacterium]